MVVKAAIESLKKADLLKQKLTKLEPKEFASLEVIALQKELQHIYRHIFVIDINYALANKIDQDLWNIGFKLCISSLQELIKNKQYNLTQKSEYSAILSWYLSGASGYYINLLNSTWGSQKDISQTSTDLSYMAQYCLVHLGDLARYQGHKEQAQNFYEQAIKLAPAFGHAYNQLALLEPKLSSKEALKICSLYCRSATCPQPFAPGHNNLMRLLEEYKIFEFSKIISSEDYISAFLKQIYYVLNNSIYDMKIENPINIQLKNRQCIEVFILITYTYSKMIESASKESELSKDEEILKQIILRHYIHLFTVLDRTENAYKTAYIFLSWIIRKEHLLDATIFKTSYKSLEKYFKQIIIDVIEYNSDCDEEGIIDEESELINFLPFGLLQNENILSEYVQEEVCCIRVMKWTNFVLEKISESSGIKEIEINTEGKNEDNDMLARTVQPNNSRNKPKIRTRTNVAMQTILQMQHNLKLNDDNTLENESDDKAIKSLYSLPIDSPPLPPSDWIDESSNVVEGNEESNPIYNSFNFLDRNDMSYTSVLSGINSSSSLWDNGSSYSLFSGHSPLAKLLEDQKTKYDTNVIK